MQFILLAIAVCVCFLLSYIQTYQLAGRGSDHQVHLFLARVVRENRHRLFVKVPRLINEAHCSATPLFLHWGLSFLSDTQIEKVSTFLNPLVNCAVIIVTFVAARHNQSTAAIAGWASLGLALTPQFQHAYSARNYGLSSRPMGLLFFTLIGVSLAGKMGISQEWSKLMVLLAAGYFIWGFNTFAVQSLIFMSVLMGLCFRDWRMLFIGAASLLLFVVINRQYAVYYLKYTFLFMKAYASDLASVFVNKKRYSLWRDLIWDIWIKIRQNPKSGLAYAYENSVLIVSFLNPFAIVALSSYFLFLPTNAGVQDWEKLVLSGFCVFLLTTFRVTRFLGEPERYIEMISPVAAIVGVYALLQRFGASAMLGLLSYCVLLDVAQIAFARELARRLSRMDPGLAQIRQMIEAEFGREPVRFCSNDEQVTKYLMTAPWEFARVWSAEQRFGGVRARDAFSEFPFIRKEPFEKVLRDYRINACVLHKTNFKEIFHDSSDSRRLKLLSESDRYLVYRIHW